MRVLFAAAALTLLAGCATTSESNTQPRPAGIGGGPNQLRRAPCACNEIKQDAALPSFLAVETASA